IIPDADRDARVVLIQHFDLPAGALTFDEAVHEGAGLNDFAVAVHVTEHARIAFDGPGVRNRLGFQRDAAVLRLNHGLVSPGGTAPATVIGTFCICIRGTSPPSTGGRFSSARTSLMVIQPFCRPDW